MFKVDVVSLLATVAYLHIQRIQIVIIVHLDLYDKYTTHVTGQMTDAAADQNITLTTGVKTRCFPSASIFTCCDQ